MADIIPDQRDRALELANPGVRRGDREFQLALFGVFGCGNFGNDATLEACLSGLRATVPKAQILGVAANPTRVAATYGIACVPLATRRFAIRTIAELHDLYRAWRLCRRVRTFVIAGTGVLDDQHVRPWHLPLDVFRWSVAARLAGARLVFLAVGAGPIEQRWSRILLTRAVKLAGQVSYRDQRSMDYMAMLGRDVRSDRVLPDLALSAVPPIFTVAARRKAGCRIAIGILSKLNWEGRKDRYQRYEDNVVQLVQQLTRDRGEVVLVKGDAVDVDTQQAILRRPELAGLAVRGDESRSFDEVVRIASTCDAMIASRYHNVVAAVIAGIPVVSLGYGPKNVALLEQLGVARWSHDIDRFDADEVVKQIGEAMLRGGILYRDQLRTYRDVLQREFDCLAHE